MGVNWQKRKTEKACGMRWRQEEGAGDAGTARPCTAAATAGLGRVGVADVQEAVLCLAPGKLNMSRWVAGRQFHGPAKPSKSEHWPHAGPTCPHWPHVGPTLWNSC